MRYPHQPQLDHIDPQISDFICGFDNELNHYPTTFDYNVRKHNRFVPYRINGFPAPKVFGDYGEFLINGKWVVCEFGGKLWMDESRRIGFGLTKAGKTSMNGGSKHIKMAIKGGVTQGQLNVENGHWEDIRPKTIYAVSKGVLLTNIYDGHVYYYPTREMACEKHNLHRTSLRKVIRGEFRKTKGFTAIAFEA